MRYMMYISRNGRLLIVNERGDQLSSRAAIREAHASWDLDMQRTRGSKNEPLHPSFNIIFSMPAKTDPDKMLAAVQAFARDRFHRHQYVLAIHTKETDPADNAPEHPHVHLILRAEDEDGRRIHIRKSDLRSWREGFAEQLRARGINANATSRAERGQSFKSMSSAEWHIQRRYKEGLRTGRASESPRAKSLRFVEAAKELQDGDNKPKPWEVAMAARRRDVARDLAKNAALLRQEGDDELADQVDRFMQNLPPLDTERRQIQRALVEQVRKRQHERGQDKQNDIEPEV
ncbi:relaxase/mobilization nuclease domain-containing protein [Massilia sp. DD77]|uniref:relaxase/mobilization nuclease domain-containing protein n=1 Tax=Massilia sp. DD77 TaxID=3109349 RepID=UPI002FFDFB1F